MVEADCGQRLGDHPRPQGRSAGRQQERGRASSRLINEQPIDGHFLASQVLPRYDRLASGGWQFRPASSGAEAPPKRRPLAGLPTLWQPLLGETGHAEAL
jgi:hypothetical protein